MWGNRGAGGDYIWCSKRYEQPRYHTTDYNYHPEAKMKQKKSKTGGKGKGKC